MTLSVIGAGFGRTGTKSMKQALEILDFSPCYHMLEVLPDKDRVGPGGKLRLALRLIGIKCLRDIGRRWIGPPHIIGGNLARIIRRQKFC